MSKRFDRQYELLGLQVPPADMTTLEKSEIIYFAAAKILGIDPAGLPVVHQLPEEFQAFPVAAFRLQVIREALASRRKADWNNRQERKWGPWFWMDSPGFRFSDSYYVITNAV